jgi:hypothetical protein
METKIRELSSKVFSEMEKLYGSSLRVSMN